MRTLVVVVVLGVFGGIALGGVAPAAAADRGFYVAIAPYLTQTHPCTYHVTGSCQAELKRATFGYTLRSTDGAFVRSGTVRAGADGFVEWWLPRNKTYVVTFERHGRRGGGTFSTRPKDPTCITTIRLK